MRVPSAPVDTTAASATLLTSDGLRLPAEIAVPDGARGGAVLLHPHPRFGGNRLNAVVAALFRSLPAAGIAALRFDFRPGAGGEGGDLGRSGSTRLAGLDVARRPRPRRRPCSSSATRSAPPSASASTTRR